MPTAEQLGFGQSATSNVYNTSGRYETPTTKNTSSSSSTNQQSIDPAIILGSGGFKRSSSSKSSNLPVSSAFSPTVNSSPPPLQNMGSSSGEPPGWSNVGAVFKSIATLQPIRANTGNTVADTVLGLSAQSLGTAALGFGALGVAGAGVDFVAGAIAGTGAPAAAELTAGTGAASTPSWLIPAAAGLGAGFFLFGQNGQQQETTASQTTTPYQNPTQNTNPYQDTTQSSGGGSSDVSGTTISGGSGSIFNYTQRNTYNTSTSNQLTYSYQISSQATYPSQDVSPSQTSSDSLLPIILAVGAVLLLNNQR